MTSRNRFGLAALAITLALGGCSSSTHHEPADDAPAEPAGPVEREATSVKITMTDVPAVVRSGFEKAYPGVTIKQVQRETYKSGTIHYEFDFTTPDGQQRDAEFDANGELLPEH